MRRLLVAISFFLSVSRQLPLHNGQANAHFIQAITSLMNEESSVRCAQPRNVAKNLH